MPDGGCHFEHGSSAVAAAPGPHVDILLCTRNGARHLRAQLASILSQSHADWTLWIADDGSTDGTREVLEAFRVANPGRRIRIVSGPKRGAAANFLALLLHPGLSGGPVALADQDDVWFPDKIARALDLLGPALHGGPAVYTARSRLTDADLLPRGLSPRHRRRPGFGNALAQNVVAGNTALLNPAAVALLRRAGPQPGLPFHDWWIYLLVTAAGGSVVVDPAPVLFYRQHDGNLIGTSRGIGAALRRARHLSDGVYRDWRRANLEALARAADLLTPANRRRVAALASAPEGGPGLVAALLRAGVHRQSPGGTLALMAAALAGRA